MFHERTKHIRIDCQFVHEKIQQNLISIGYVKTGKKFGDIFTKSDHTAYTISKPNSKYSSTRFPINWFKTNMKTN